MSNNGSLPLPRCATCGKCCITMGCHYSPDDFNDLSYDNLKAEIDKGYISIDWWDNDDDSKGFYLRIRNRNANIVNPSFGGLCSLLTPTGCPLPFEKRPKGARFLDAVEAPGCCAERYTKQDCKDDWAAYNDVLKELYEHYCDENCLDED